MRTRGPVSLGLVRGLAVAFITAAGLGAIVGSGGGGDAIAVSDATSATLPSEGGVLSVGGRPIVTIAPNTLSGPADITLALAPSLDADAASAQDIRLSIPVGKLIVGAGGEITLNFHASDLRSVQTAGKAHALAAPAAIDPAKLCGRR